MKKIISLLVIVSVFGCSGNKDGKNSQTGATETPSSTFTPISLNCPTGFVAVPFLAGYTTQNFCVAKYEMKNRSGAKSEAAGVPWASINRADAISACSAMGVGYSLMTVAQHETVAKNIYGMARNWSDGTYNGPQAEGIQIWYRLIH